MNIKIAFLISMFCLQLCAMDASELDVNSDADNEQEDVISSYAVRTMQHYTDSVEQVITTKGLQTNALITSCEKAGSLQTLIDLDLIQGKKEKKAITKTLATYRETIALHLETKKLQDQVALMAKNE